MKLGRRSSAAAVRFLGLVRRALQLALSGRGRRRAALTAPRPAAHRWRSWRRLCYAAALEAAWRSAAATPWLRLVSRHTRCVVLGGSRSLRVVVGAVTFPLRTVTVTRRSRRRDLRRRAGASGAGFVVLPHSRRLGARPPRFRDGASLSRLGASYSAARASACGRWRGRSFSGGGRRRAALTAPLPRRPSKPRHAWLGRRSPSKWPTPKSSLFVTERSRPCKIFSSP